MTSVLRIKRRQTGAVGAPTSLANAELAYNEVNHTLYYGEGTGGSGGSATTVVPIGGSGAFLPLGGGTLAGPLTLSADPVAALQPATRQYVDARSGMVVPTIAALRVATTATLPATNVAVRSYAGVTIKGGGWFLYVSTDTTTADNGGTIIVDASGRRWYREGSQDQPLNVHWFGGRGDGATDDAGAVRLALAALSPLGGEIYFPTGIYKFASTVTFTYPTTTKLFSLTVRGSGADVSLLDWISTNGLVFNLSAPSHTIHVQYMTIMCDSVGTSIGVQITQTATQLSPQSQNDFTGVTFRGSDPYSFSNYWATAVVGITINETNFIGCDFFGGTVGPGPTPFVGTAVVIQGASISEPSFVQNFVACSFSNMFQAVVYGDFLQGMTFSQCNFGGLAFGIHQPAGAGATFVGAELEITGCQFYATSVDVNIEGTLDDIGISSTLFFHAFPNSEGFAIPPTGVVNRLTINGCQFEGTDQNNQAIVLQGTLASSVVISGNVFYANKTGIFFPTGGTAVGVIITGNTIQGLAPNTTGNAGIVVTGTLDYGLFTSNLLTMLSVGINLGVNCGFSSVQSNSYNTCAITVQNANGTNLIGGGSP